MNANKICERIIDLCPDAFIGWNPKFKQWDVRIIHGKDYTVYSDEDLSTILERLEKSG